MSDPSSSLQRSIGPIRATAMVVGTIIGASIFVQPSVVTGEVGSVAGVVLVWAAAGLLTLFGALVTAELGSALPQTGGVYVFLRAAFSPALGFLWAWAMFWTMHSGIIAAISVVFARYVGHFTTLSDTGTKLVGIGAVWALSIVNYLGVRHGSALQTAFTIGKVAAVLAIIVIGFALGDSSGGALAAGAPPGEPWSIGDFATALGAGLFAFGGWHMVSYTAGETIDPERTIPRALLYGVLLVTACYIALNLVYLYVLPLETVTASDRVAADAARVVLGDNAAGAVSALVVFSSFGALSGIVLVGPRVYYAMAQDGLVFRWIGGVHPKYRTPHRAIILQAIWSSVLVATGTFRVLFTRVVYTEWIFFGLMALGLIMLRRQPAYKPAYRVWGFPVVPLVFALASAGIVVNQIVRDPLQSGLGLGMVAIGLPVYLVWLWIAKTGRGTEGA